MRTRRYRLRLSTAVLLVIGVVAASTTGHVMLKRSSTPSLEFISEQVARMGASGHESNSGSGALLGNSGVADATPVPMSEGYGGVSGGVAEFLSLGGFTPGTANWQAALASGVAAVEDLMAQLEAPGAGGGSIDGMQLASADSGLVGGQGGGSASGGGAGGEALAAGFGSDAPLSFVEGGSGGGAGRSAGGSAGGSAGVPGNGSTDLPSIAAPVPEPSTYLMMLGGLAAVGTMLRRRREMMN